MSQEPEVKAAIISSKSGIWIAIIGLVGGLLIAILTPFATKWANRADPTPNASSLAIEQIPQTIFPYAGIDEGKGGTSAFRIIYDQSLKPIYRFDYTLSSNSDEYGRLAFQFDQGQDVSEFKAIEFTIQFLESADVIQIHLIDIAKAGNSERITAKNTSEMKVTIPLENFKDIELKALKEIAFNAETGFSIGTNKILISDIRFVR